MAPHQSSDFSAVIEAARLEACLSRAELARRMEVNRSRVSALLNHSPDVKVSTLARALRACGYRLLFGREEL